MKIKIAHTADIHIGFKEKKQNRNFELKQHELKNTFFKILDTCKNQNIDFLLISGDLFNDVNISYIDLNEIKTAISECEFNVIISPGNHDPFTTDSPYNSKWPANVFIFSKNTIDFFEFKEKNVRIYGAAFNDLYEKENILNSEINIDENFINICSLHADLIQNSQNAQSIYRPITCADIEKSKMDYLALGHIHKRTSILKAGHTFYSYCGCPEGTGFDELGEKGFYIGEISKNYCDLKFQKICERTYEKVLIDISEISSDIELKNFIIKKIHEKYQDNYEKNYYQITLTGLCDKDFFVDVTKLELSLQSLLFFVKVKDETMPAIDLEKLKYQNDIKSTFIKKIMCSINNTANLKKKSLLEKALKIGLMSFEKEVLYNED